MTAAECSEVLIVLPDGSMERDDKGLVPPSCPVDPIPAHLLPVDDDEYETFFDRILNFDGREYDEYAALFMDSRIGDQRKPGTRLQRYVRMRLDGQSHNMAYMLASKSFPGVKTDAVFNEGRCNGNQFEACPARGDWLRREAGAAGVSTTGKWYASGLASFPGDPTAWVSDRHDVVAVAKAKGLNVEGFVTHKESPRGVVSSDTFEVAPKLLRDEAAAICRDNPGASFDAVYDKVKEIRSGSPPPNPKDLA